MNKTVQTIEKFIKRMKSIGIEINASLNFPWIYIDRINGMAVTEKRFSEHKFTLGFATDESMFKDNLDSTFKLLRKYKNLTKIKK